MATNVEWHSGSVAKEDHYVLLKQERHCDMANRSIRIWKSTVSVAMEQMMLKRVIWSTDSTAITFVVASTATLVSAPPIARRTSGVFVRLLS